MNKTNDAIITAGVAQGETTLAVSEVPPTALSSHNPSRNHLRVRRDLTLKDASAATNVSTPVDHNVAVIPKYAAAGPANATPIGAIPKEPNAS